MDATEELGNLQQAIELCRLHIAANERSLERHKGDPDETDVQNSLVMSFVKDLDGAHSSAQAT